MANATEDKCASCGRKLVMCVKGHYICTRCTKNHDCRDRNKKASFGRLKN